MLRTLLRQPTVARGLSGAQSRFASSLVLAEHDGATLSDATRSAINAASQLGDVAVLVCGSEADTAAAAAGKTAGVSKVLYSKTDSAGFIPETIAPVVLASQSQFNFSHIIAGASAVGKNVLPRVAAKLDVSMVSEVTSIESEDTFTRLIYAGNAVCKVKSNDAVKIMTVRPTNFDPAATDGGAGDTADVEAAPAQDMSSFVGQELSKSDRPSLTAASTVVAGGRGLKDGDNFEMLNTMADKLGAAVGASRAAVDAGYVPNDYQIGQTGKIVAPELYIAVGISGAIQHLAGMKDSKVIAAINTDPDAPIFQVADFGLVEDLFKAVPEMNDKL
mmetsp:Transcript_23216/g.60744  ORF Transcript_23216/g.60744 Transcript_23216/m.60744 type:complete len:332 (+) Transcript_23216:43-1038(+)|eukprot:CAMPEP_0182925292 /NCGR_PEP_ID=MMETSP0105_2-20130417/9075_1 /TAXON_ID=81532 ORGANISM="Acanthoeca-like sp., Strain 10tr" /NCGR_SAMPLE_ID=MMETSP0105_2 /ASSEMBLY_ACC=CAM_ASM_000205 /LENGTH=331 /DNA_ID=CAMNT_0025063133 /DNA_START=21 /DNA_END=1016 /DNA_ORIENTATION=+